MISNMKKFIFLFFIIFLWFSKTVFSQINCSETFNFDWINNLGGAYADNITDVKTDTYNNIYITGYIRKNISYKGQNYNLTDTMAFFVAKLNPIGNLLWIKAVNISENTNSVNNYKLAVDKNNNVFVFGTFLKSITIEGTTLNASNNGHDIFLIKYSDTGSLIFAQRYGSTNDDYSGGIVVDENNNIIISGSFTNVIIISGTAINASGPSGSYDNFIAKLNNNGGYIWNAHYSSSTDDYAKDITCDSDGNVYAIGTFAGTINSSVGNITATVGQQDLFVMKFNSDGIIKFIQSKPLVSIDYEVNRIFVTDNGDIYFTYTGLGNTKVSKYNNSGINTLNITLGSGATNLKAKGIVVDNLGYIYVTGNFIGTHNFGDGNFVGNLSSNSLFVVKYDNSGIFVDKSIGTNINDASFYSICFQDYRNIIVVGKFFNTVGPISQNSNGSSDGLIMKLSNKFYFKTIEQISHGCSASNNDVHIAVEGGTAPYSFLWSTGAVTQNLIGVAAGSYTVTATDNLGCKIIANIEVSVPSAEPINLPATMTICYFDTITLNAGNFNSFIWSTGATTQTISVYQENTYSVTATDNNGCSTSTDIIIQKTPNINILHDTNFICYGQSLQLSTLNNYQNYLWSTAAVSSSISVSNAGSCWVRVYDGNCYYYDTTKLIVRPKFNVSLGPNKYICDGQTITLSPDAVFPEYLWSNGSNASVYTVINQGNYWIRVKNELGCFAYDTIQIIHEYTPIANLGNDTAICNSLFLLPSQNPYQSCSYLWNTGETTKNITINSSGTYWVLVTSTHNVCSVSDTITIQMYPEFKIDLGTDKHICKGESVTFTIQEDLSYIQWMDGSSQNSLTVDNEKKVTVIAKDQNGCFDKDSVNVYLHEVSLPYLGKDTVLCLGVKFLLTPNNEYPHYKWNTGSTANSCLVSIDGNYSLTVSDNYGCTNSDAIVIKYEDSPKIVNLSEIYGTITIVADYGTMPYLYALDVVGNWYEYNVFSNCEEGLHNVFIIDANKCLDSATINVNPKYKIPSFFTPNNDGFNDTWEIEGFHLFPRATAIIFDRYGKQLYIFNGGEKGWNGTYLGNPVTSDTYWYVVDFGNGIAPVKGSVTIVR